MGSHISSSPILQENVELIINFEQIPEYLKSRKQWVVWGRRAEKGIPALNDEGGLDKIPCNSKSGGQAMSNNPTTWTSFEQAVKAYETGFYNGIGFMFAEGDNLVGIDLDHCLNSNLVATDAAQAILKKFPNTYVEISPSGDGLHIYCFGLAIHCGKGSREKWIELYGKDINGKRSNRYFCVTGNRYFTETTKGNPEITDGQAALSWLHETFKKEIPKLKPVTPSVTPSINHLEKYLATVFDSEIANVQTSVEGSRNDTLFKAAVALKELCNSDWAKPYINESQVEAQLLAATSLPEMEARKTITSAFKTAGTREEPKRVVAESVINDVNNSVINGVIPKQPKLVYYDDNDKPKLLKQNQAAKALISEIQQLRFDAIAEEWMLWKDNYWQRSNNTAAMKAINDIISDNSSDCGYSVSYVTGIAQFLKWELMTEQWNTARNIVPLKNGVLDLNTMELTPHSPEHNLTWQLPYEYDPHATCDPIIDWLFETVTEPDQVELLRAYLNCIVLGRVELQKYLELIGPGGTGKSTFIRLAEALVGSTNTHVTEFKRLEGDAGRFETARIYGKRLVVITDSERFAGNIAVFKAMIGQDPLPYEEKNKQGSRPNFKNQAMVLVAANEPIQSTDYSSGRYRRPITIHFDNVVAPTARRDLEQEFKSLLPGLLNWVLAMSPERVEELMIDTAKFVPSLNIVTRENLIATNPMAAWLDTCVVYDLGVETSVGQAFREKEGGYRNSNFWLYPSYCEYCDGSGIKPISMRRFSDLLIDLCRN